MAINIRLQMQVLSVNRAFQGRRFRTPEYKAYEKELLYRLPMDFLPPRPYKITFEFGMSNIQSDWDNPVKPLQDILQKRYGFNDAHIMEATVRKIKVDKGMDYFTVTIEHFNTTT